MTISFTKPGARGYSPSGNSLDNCLQGVTHLAVGAHADDLEFMAGHAILECQQVTGRAFAGVTVAAGAEDARMRETRRCEQEEAARIGHYRAIFMLDHASQDLKSGNRAEVVKDLAEIFLRAEAECIYTHNPADKHDTHVAVFLAVVEALRSLPSGKKPRAFWGCEVWRGLDWLSETDKKLLDVSGGEALLTKLMAVYKSQLADKAYDLAVLGRKRSNATFLDPYASDAMTLCEYAMDLMPLLHDPSLSVEKFIQSKLEAFQKDVLLRLKRCVAF